MRVSNRVHIKQFIQFLMAGALNAVVDLTLLNVFSRLWPTTDTRLLLLFNTIAYLGAVTCSYFLNSRFAFRHHAQKNLREKALFVLQAAISLVVSNLVFWAGLHLFTFFDLPFWMIQNIAKILAMAIPSFTSFILMKFLVFRKAN